MAKVKLLPGEILELLNLALGLEYSMLVRLPQLRDAADRAGLGQQVWQSGEEAACHAETLTDAIRRLGGNPGWSFAAPAGEVGALGSLRMQLERELHLSRIYGKAAGLVAEPELRVLLPIFAQTERGHAHLLIKALRKLAPHEPTTLADEDILCEQLAAVCVC
jgi:hypothetical protein